MAVFPQRCGDINAAWLNEVLPADVRNGGTVCAIDIEVIGEGVGLMGEVARLTMQYESGGPVGVRTAIVKVPTENEGFKHVGLMLGLYQKEHGFYADASQHVPVSIPRAYYNAADEESGNFALVMEDMAPRRCGNQLDGCSREEAELALRELARFHATWWESPLLDEFKRWLPDTDDPYFELLEGAYVNSLPHMDAKFGHLLSEHVRGIAWRNQENYREFFDRGGGRRPHTMVHGDFRLDNMMFSQSDAGLELTLLDFQIPFRANGLWDVVYFLAGNFTPEWRREHQHQLVQLYHSALIDAGVADYPFDQCWQDYRACALVLLGYIVTGAADFDPDTLNERGQELLSVMFGRYAVAIEDLGSAEFLD